MGRGDRPGVGRLERSGDGTRGDSGVICQIVLTLRYTVLFRIAAAYGPVPCAQRSCPVWLSAAAEVQLLA